MAAQHVDPIKTKGGKGALIACCVLFILYFINLIIGKVNIAYGMKLPHLGHVAEFLLLFAVSVLLIIAALKDEAAEEQTSTQTIEEAKNDT